MKNAFLVLFFLTLFFNVRAQDSIVKKNGEIVIAKILEIGTSEIKYKRSDVADGPLYVEYKSNIERIRFANGVLEIFKNEPAAPIAAAPAPSYYMIPELNNKIGIYGNNYTYRHNKINERQLYAMLYATHDKKIMNLADDAKNAKIAQYIGFGAIPFGLVSYYCLLAGTGELNTAVSNNGTSGQSLVAGGLCLAAAISCPIASGIFKMKRTRSNHAAIALYNEKF